ncbi:GntR family transcriptional regulator [Devosia geojensis]|uniref:GntR family transcriptional regulator n=1 Tax=Devosia geojensis TaxID=443610 RepID=A0A0F5FUU2_9HYPH|nr:GntR family transcriptional regulator [Devosia geojensis]KKB12624.1 GntR family transcriptional regulator [Devosia geojensis]
MVTVEKRAAAAGALKRPTRLGEEVYNVIYAQLMSRQIPPGGRISVDRLVRELGVSQTPIREALSRLEAQGLVVKTHLIGYSAADQMDSARLEQLYELRLLLEPFAAARAAMAMSEETHAALVRLAADMQACEDEPAGEAYGRFAQLDSDFHDLIAEASGNELIQETLAGLHIHVHLFRLFYHARVTADAIGEHQRIIDALAARDPQASETAMRHHLERSRERFTKAFAR